MKKALILILGATLPTMAFAQAAIDAQQVSQSDFKGTARFMSMGGAFTALGGDMTTLNQNPAGIGIYRSSELGVTLDIDMQKTKSPMTHDMTQTKVYCNNFGYVGATRLDGALRTLNWGVTFNRAASFDRVYQGYVPKMASSLSGYIASISYGIPYADMETSDWNKYNPYLDTSYDWLSILGYRSYLTSPVGPAQGGGSQYAGLFTNGTEGEAWATVREKGYVDEYNISFGGNVEDVVYWGLSIGITDLNYRRWTTYTEEMINAEVGDDNGVPTNCDFGYDLSNYKSINGSGWNLKAGVIIKPINEFRLGLAVHTPTFYKLNQSGSGTIDFAFTPCTTDGVATGEKVADTEYTDDSYFEWQLNAPWKFMVGAAAVVGGRMILSADYEFAGYNSMKVRTPYHYDQWGGYDFESDPEVNNAISETFKNQNTIRIGAEYRLTPQLSVRGGYSYVASNVKKEAYDNAIVVQTAGTDPSYTFDDKTNYITCGLGYKYKSWYIDAAYVYKNRESMYHAYTNYDGRQAPQFKVTDNNSSIVLSTGFKF